jgi:aspartate kinase
VSIVGTGIQSHPGYAARMFGTLSDAGINIQMITTSDIRITCLIDEAAVEQATRALHAAFIEEATEGAG